MALPATSFIDVRVGGNDNNGGGFSTGASNVYPTDLTATSGNTSTPTVSSASYTFVAGDVNDWLYVASGTNWLPGWYQITSVSAGSATVSASANTAPNYNTSVGVASVASPTGGSWTIDRSQRNSASVVIDNSTVTASIIANVATLSGYTVRVCDVGNWVHFLTGTNITAGWYQIWQVSTASNNWSLAGTTSIPSSGTTTNATGNMGGSLATPGKAGAAAIGGNDIHIQSGGTAADYSISSSTSNASNGRMTTPNGVTGNMTKLIGYQTAHYDYGTAPTIKATTGMGNASMITCGTQTYVANLTLDANTQTLTGCITTNGTGVYYKILAKNGTTGGMVVNGTSNYVIQCQATGCTNTNSVAAIACGGTNNNVIGCVAYSNTTTGFTCTSTSANFHQCISCNNSGASSHGFDVSTGGHSSLKNCTTYNNGGSGFVGTTGSTNPCTYINCVSVSNAAWGFTTGGADDGSFLFNCSAYNNTSGQVNTGTSAINVLNVFGTITLTGSPFTAAGSGDFSLNNTAGAGAALRGAGIPASWPGISTNSYPDVGAAQHQDSGGSMPMITGLGGALIRSIEST